MTFDIKKNFKIKLICVFRIAILIFGLHYSSLAQDLEYEIFVESKSVGTMKVTKSAFISGGLIIDLTADFKVEMLGTSRIQMYATSYFKKNVLTNAESILERNGRIKESCTVSLVKSKYRIERRNENVSSFEGMISTTLNQMYLSEPKGKTEVFAERYGDLCAIRETKPGTYDVTLPTGSIIRFVYKNGICVMTQNVGNLQEMVIKLKE